MVYTNEWQKLVHIYIIHWSIATHMPHRGFLLLKSFRLKNTATQSSFHSKLWTSSIIHQLTFFWCQLMYYWKMSSFEWNDDRVTVFLKWTDFISAIFQRCKQQNQVKIFWEGHKNLDQSSFLIWHYNVMLKNSIFGLYPFWLFLLLTVEFFYFAEQNKEKQNRKSWSWYFRKL